MKRDLAYLKHMLDAITRIEKFSSGLNREEFMKDEMVQSAIVRQLEIIGEAVKRISDETKRGRSEIPWGRIAGMRNRLIHRYFDVDFDEVWKVVEDDLPRLKIATQSMIEQLFT
jgi:uncharacterized protein with HEPN domain